MRVNVAPSRVPGVTIFFTGLSGSGKSTVANALCRKLQGLGTRAVTLLDGDVVRQHLSSELGFSKEHRDLNVRRVGFVASEVTRHGGLAICALIAPYDEIRKEVRRMIEQVGRFVLIHLSTPVETCENRDLKGLYAKARRGLLPNFTGISDPYECPDDAEMTFDTSNMDASDVAGSILSYLTRNGLVVDSELSVP